MNIYIAIIVVICLIFSIICASYDNITKKKEKTRKRKSITFLQRQEILKKLEDGIPGVEVAKEYGVAQSTISEIKKNKDEIVRRIEVLTSCHGDLNKKKYKGTEESTLELSVYNKMCEMKDTGAPIDGPSLQQVALDINEKLPQPSKFAGTDGWLRGFRKRHCMRIKNTKAEKPSVDLRASESFKTSFQGFLTISGISNANCIYSCDETGLYWKLLPSKIEKEVSDFKSSKARVTIMTSCNASGTHKIPLYIIGKSKKSRCFTIMKQLPIKYTSQSRARMDQNLMMDWFKECFIPAVRKYHNLDQNPHLKIVLLMDNASCHPPIEEFHKVCGFVTVIFLPPNTTSILQPLEQGIVEKFKRSYKKAMLKYLLVQQTASGFVSAYKSFTLLECFRFCIVGWNDVTETDIKNCWNALISHDGDSDSDMVEVCSSSILQLLSLLPGCTDFNKKDTNKWLNEDKCLNISEMSADEGSDNDTSSDLESDDESPSDSSEVNLWEMYNSVKFIINLSLRHEDEILQQVPAILEPIRLHLEDKLIEQMI